MANVQLDWTNPVATDIQEIEVFRFTGDYAALAAADATLDLSNADDDASNDDGRKILTSEQAQKFIAVAGAAIDTQAYASGAATYTDSTANFGDTYVYGVFSKNSGGYGPGELELQAV